MQETRHDKGKRPHFLVSPFKINENVKPIPRASSVASTSKIQESRDDNDDDVDEYRYKSALRLRSVWESIAERYSRRFADDDEIDLIDMKIVTDRGFLRHARERPIGFYGLPGERVPLPSWVKDLPDDESATDLDGDDDDDNYSNGESEDELGQWDEGECAISNKAREERRIQQETLSDLNEFMAAENKCRAHSVDTLSIYTPSDIRLSSPSPATSTNSSKLLRNINALRLESTSTSTSRSYSPSNHYRSASLRPTHPSLRLNTTSRSYSPSNQYRSSPLRPTTSSIVTPSRKISTNLPATSPLRNLSNEDISPSRRKCLVEIKRNPELRRRASQKENTPEPSDSFASDWQLENSSGSDRSSTDLSDDSLTSCSLNQRSLSRPRPRSRSNSRPFSPIMKKSRNQKISIGLPKRSTMPKDPKPPDSTVINRSVSLIPSEEDSDDGIIAIYPSSPHSTPSTTPISSHPSSNRNIEDPSISSLPHSTPPQYVMETAVSLPESTTSAMAIHSSPPLSPAFPSGRFIIKMPTSSSKLSPSNIYHPITQSSPPILPSRYIQSSPLPSPSSSAKQSSIPHLAPVYPASSPPQTVPAQSNLSQLVINGDRGLQSIVHPELQHTTSARPVSNYAPAQTQRSGNILPEYNRYSDSTTRGSPARPVSNYAPAQTHQNAYVLPKSNNYSNSTPRGSSVRPVSDYAPAKTQQSAYVLSKSNNHSDSTPRGSVRYKLNRSSEITQRVTPERPIFSNITPPQRSASVRPSPSTGTSIIPKRRSVSVRPASSTSQHLKSTERKFRLPVNEVSQNSILLRSPSIPSESSDDGLSLIPSSTPRRKSSAYHKRISPTSTPDRIQKMLIPETSLPTIPLANRSEHDIFTRKSDDISSDDELGQWEMPRKRRRV